MALLGRPKAGDVVRAQLRIKESKEFKVSFNGCLEVVVLLFKDETPIAYGLVTKPFKTVGKNERCGLWGPRERTDNFIADSTASEKNGPIIS